jgi:regulator of protease activity HflC (stomatin/prohibitin superfamily)
LDAAGGGHQGLVFGAAVLVAAGTIVAAFCGIQTGSLVLKALALEAAVITLAVWLTLHAARIRLKIVESLEWARDEHDEYDEDEENVSEHDVHHAVAVHYAALLGPLTVLFGGMAAYLLWRPIVEDSVLKPDFTATASIICLVACCVWLVLSRSFQAAGRDELPEAPALTLAFRDLQWSTLLVAIGVLGTMVWPKEVADGAAWAQPEIWVARLLLIWVLVVSLEQLARLAIAWLHRLNVERGFASPIQLLAREAVFVRGNPIASVFETIEARFGVSFRSSWAIRFVRAAALPSLVLVLLLFWALTSVTVVGTSDLAVRESFGRIEGKPLGPGLHWKLPWPFGRVRSYPVKQVFTMPVGFQPTATRQKAYLWSKEHALEEYNLILGNGNEAVAVNALLYYKILEDERGFLDYVYQWSEGKETGRDPEAALDAYAHRALMEQTQSATLEQILSANREEFAGRIEESIRRCSREHRLGIDVVDVALIALHPPIEAAADYLDVISARIDANRLKIEANGERAAMRHSAEATSDQRVADARVEAARMMGDAYGQSAEFIALNQAFAVAPEAFKLRYWYEAQEEALAGKKLVVVDSSLVEEKGELLFDLRSVTEPRGRNDIVPAGTIPMGVR